MMTLALLKEIEMPINVGMRQSSQTDGRVNQVVTNLNSSIQKVQRILVFSVNGRSGQIFINVTNTESGDTLRQVHSEDALQIAEKLLEMINSGVENISA